MDWGAFAGGMAPGVSRAANMYIQQKMAKIDQEQKVAVMQYQWHSKLYSDKSQPKALRKQSWQKCQQISKSWNMNLNTDDISDEMWDEPKLQSYFDRGQKIMGNKDYSLPTIIESLQGLQAEARSVFGEAGTQGMFKPWIAGAQQKAFVKGVGGMQPGQPMSPETQSLLGAGGKAGLDFLSAHGAPAKAAAPKTPSISMYETMDMGDGTSQKYQWNPKTGKHDIKAGKASKQKKGDKPVYRTSDGDIWRFNVDGSQEKLVQGSKRHFSIQNAMREMAWFMGDESEQAELIAKHERLYEGKAGSKPKVKLTRKEAQNLLDQAKGDMELAHKLAEDLGYTYIY